jgi:hypothetical protein
MTWKSIVGAGLIGIGIGHYSTKQASVTLYGGSFTSSPLADIFGYAEDYSGCRQISACLNYAQNKEMLTEKFSMTWANNGVHYCK